MKVLTLMPLAEQRGGAEQLLRTALFGSESHGIDHHLVFFEDGPLVDQCKAHNIPATVLPTGRLRNMARYARTVRRLISLIRQIQPDCVLSWMSKAHLYAGPAAWWTGTPALWYQHGLSHNTGWMDRLITWMPADHVLACSQAAANAQQARWPQRPARVLHPCADVNDFNPDELPRPKDARAKLGLPDVGPLIGIVGRLQRWKGIHVFVEALPHVLDAYPNAHGMVVGGKHDLEPDYPELLHELILKHNLDDHITVAGFQENIPLWMQVMDVFVHASDHEPFGIVIVEAMALGKPVVAGASGGPREIITHEQNGLLAPYGDNETLAQRILRYLDNPDFARRMGRAAQKRAQDFSPEVYAERFVETLYEIVPSPEQKPFK